MKYIVTLNNKQYEVEVTESDAVITAVTDAAGAPAVVAAAPAAANAAVGGQPVKAPMPGNILQVKVSVGQKVKAGDVLFILEAMKMENEIAAPVGGTVKQILVEKGAVVDTGAVLAVL